MTKSQVGTLLKVLEAIIHDVASFEPDLRDGLMRDLSRINSSTSSMGMVVLLTYLPDIGKYLEYSLSQGFLAPTTMPLMRRRRRGSHIPRLFQGMWLKLFDDRGCLQHNADPIFVRYFLQITQVFRKFDQDCPKEALYEQTSDFLALDSSLPSPSTDWDSPSSIGVSYDSCTFASRGASCDDQYDLFARRDSDEARMLDIVQRVADTISLTIGLFDYRLGRHGPGAVQEGYRSIAEKYSFKRWHSRLDEQFPFYGTAVSISEYGDVDYTEDESHSVLLAVPKTFSGPRLIAKEPSEHMFNQFSIMDFLVERVSRSWISNFIDFQDQEVSGGLCIEASRSGHLATIDLKSASDRMSLWAVERFFRKNEPLLVAMRACRTRFIDLSIDDQLPSLHKLRKFSTQGSALTFPVQSIIFLGICIAGTLAHRGLEPTMQNIGDLAGSVRVFGDDLIVPNDAFDTVKRLLELLFFKANDQKTHANGYYRESCGVAAFKGVVVTPLYVRRIGGTDASDPKESPISASNRFFEAGYWRAGDAIGSTVKVRGIPVLKGVTGPQGWFSYSGSRIPCKWNREYQRLEVRLFGRKNRTKRSPTALGPHLLRAFLQGRERNPVEPSFEGTPDWYPYSRWESKGRDAFRWAPSTLS